MNTHHLYPKMPSVLKYPVYPIKLETAAHLTYLLRSPMHETDLLDRFLCETFGASKMIFTDSGRSALVLALRLLGIKHEDEVLLTTFNCPAVVDAVLSVGAVPVLIDIDENFRVSLDAAKQHYTKKTKAIILTHTYGVDEDDELIHWAKENGIFIIDDAAQALFKSKNGQLAGTRGDVGVLSFDSTKPLPGLGGGALIWFGDVDQIARLMEDLPTEPFEYVEKSYKEYLKYRTILLLKSRAFYLGEALWTQWGWVPKWQTNKLSSLPKRPQFISPRIMHPVRKNILLQIIRQMEKMKKWTLDNYSFLYQELFSEEYFSIIGKPDGEHGYNYFTLLFQEDGVRYDFSVHLAKYGVQTCWNYYPLHLIPLYSKFGRPAPNSEVYWKRVLSIPFKPPYTKKDLSYMVKIIKKYTERN